MSSWDHVAGDVKILADNLEDAERKASALAECFESLVECLHDSKAKVKIPAGLIEKFLSIKKGYVSKEEWL